MSTNSSGWFFVYFTPLFSHLHELVLHLCSFMQVTLLSTSILPFIKKKKRKKQNELNHCMFTSLHQQSLTISRTEVNVLSWYAFACDRNSHHSENKPQHQQQNIYSHTGNTSWQAVVSVVGDTASHYAFAFVVHTLYRTLICDDVIILSVLK